MKKDGLFSQLLKATVEEEKKKYANKPPDIFTNQKKQMWYFLMNQIDGPQAGNEADDASEIGEK